VYHLSMVRIEHRNCMRRLAGTLAQGVTKAHHDAK
jgi:hypothetical protein